MVLFHACLFKLELQIKLIPLILEQFRSEEEKDRGYHGKRTHHANHHCHRQEKPYSSNGAKRR